MINIKWQFLPVSDGQFPLLHDLLAVLLPIHLFPPCLADVASVLCLSCDPPPQDLEHSDHPPQEDHWQWTEKVNEYFFILTVNNGAFPLKTYHGDSFKCRFSLFYTQQNLYQNNALKSWDICFITALSTYLWKKIHTYCRISGSFQTSILHNLYSNPYV